MRDKVSDRHRGHASSPAFLFGRTRISYVNDHGQADTRKCSLKPAQAREIAVFMDQQEMTDRLFLQNVRRYGDLSQDSTKAAPVTNCNRA